MFQVAVPFIGLPINIVCNSHGHIAFLPINNISGIIDQPENGGISAIFDREGFSIDGENYDYGKFYAYKTHAKLLQYLKDQKFDMPDVH